MHAKFEINRLNSFFTNLQRAPKKCYLRKTSLKFFLRNFVINFKNFQLTINQRILGDSGYLLLSQFLLTALLSCLSYQNTRTNHMYNLKLKLTLSFKAARAPKLQTNGGGCERCRKKIIHWIDLKFCTVILEGLSNRYM